MSEQKSFKIMHKNNDGCCKNVSINKYDWNVDNIPLWAEQHITMEQINDEINDLRNIGNTRIGIILIFGHIFFLVGIIAAIVTYISLKYPIWPRMYYKFIPNNLMLLLQYNI